MPDTRYSSRGVAGRPAALTNRSTVHWVCSVCSGGSTRHGSWLGLSAEVGSIRRAVRLLAPHKSPAVSLAPVLETHRCLNVVRAVRHESGAGGTHGEHGHRAVGAASIYPLMPSPVLDYAVSGIEVHLGAVRHDQRNTAAEHDDVIDRVR